MTSAKPTTPTGAPLVPWEVKYRTMPRAKLHGYVAKWQAIVADAEHVASLEQGLDEDTRTHLQACRRNLRLVRRIARERGVAVPTPPPPPAPPVPPRRVQRRRRGRPRPHGRNA